MTPVRAPGNTTLIIGIGHRLRCDDAVGPLAVERLIARGLQALEHCGEGLGLISVWQAADRVIIVDAMESGAAPGTIRRFDAASAPLPAATFRSSSHLFGLGEAVETARALGRLPATLIIHAIEGRHFGFGTDPTPDVLAALDVVVENILKEEREQNKDKGALPP